MVTKVTYWECKTDPSHRHQLKREAVLCEDPSEKDKPTQGVYYQVGDKLVYLAHMLDFADWLEGAEPEIENVWFEIWAITRKEIEPIYSRPNSNYAFARALYTVVTDQGKTRQKSGIQLGSGWRMKNLVPTLRNSIKGFNNIPDSVDDWSEDMCKRFNEVVRHIQERVENFNPHLLES